eukprot:6191622-Pleurochrysis_carterae.AAC.3
MLRSFTPLDQGIFRVVLMTFRDVRSGKLYDPPQRPMPVAARCRCSNIVPREHKTTSYTNICDAFIELHNHTCKVYNVFSNGCFLAHMGPCPPKATNICVHNIRITVNSWTTACFSGRKRKKLKPRIGTSWPWTIVVMTGCKPTRDHERS